jgi:hypothetical protein
MRASCKKVGFIVICLLLFPLLVLAVGCGGSEGTVTGKVYYKGELLRAGSVNFFPESGKGGVGGPIGNDGTYTVYKVPRGQAKVSVVSASSEIPLPPGGPMGRGGPPPEAMKKYKEKMKEGMKGAGSKDRPQAPTKAIELPEKYRDPQTSGLSLQVNGGKQTFDIKME